MKNKRDKIPFYCEWQIIKREFDTGKILQIVEGENIVVKDGRDMVLRFLSGMTGSSAGSSFPYLAIGASATDNDGVGTGQLVSDVRMTYELIGNATRFTCTDATGGSFDSTDIADDVVTISGCDFYKSLIWKATIPSTDGNDGQPINEVGLATNGFTPATPTTQRGNIFNHFILPSTVTKDNGTEVIINVKIHT